MFLGLCALVVIAAVPLWRGSWRRLAELRVRGIWLGIGALVLQVAVITVWPSMPHPLAVGGHLLSYAALGWVLWLNRRIPGMVLVAAGSACNALTIAINGGTLPASPTALRAAGIQLREGFDNSGIVAHPRLSWLGDTMVTPPWLPMRNVLSIGDLLLLLGALVVVVVASRSGDVATLDAQVKWRRPVASRLARVPLSSCLVAAVIVATSAVVPQAR